MKTSVSQRPNLTCRLVRGWVSIIGDATAGRSGLGATHIETCDSCQRFFRAGDALEMSLKRDAVRLGAYAPSGLDQRIIQAVNRSARPAPQRRRSRVVALSFAGLAAGAAVAALLLWQNPFSTGSSIGTPVRIASVTQSGLGEDSMPSRLWNSLRPPVDALLEEQNPLQAEVDSVYSDAKSAVRFLTLNFLPTVPQQPDRSGGAFRRTTG